MHARMTTATAGSGINDADVERLWQEAEPFLSQIDGLEDVYSGRNDDTGEVFTLMVFVSKEASDGYAAGDVRDKVVGVFRDAVAGEMSVTEYAINYHRAG